MACCLESALLLLLLLLLGSARSTSGNRCVDAAEACTADAKCQQLRSEYVARCLGRPAPGVWNGPGDCMRSRCRRALRRFFGRGPPALTHALLFCGCEGPACAERRRQTFAPACAFAGPGPAPPSCLKPLDRCESSRLCRPRLLAFQASCAPAPGSRDGCPEKAGTRCLRAYADLVGTVITPNYLDNVSARVAPWCGCGISGNRREECEAFRKLFTRNSCLDGAIRAFDSLQPAILQGQLKPYQNAGHHFPQVGMEWPGKRWRQKQPLFSPHPQGVLAVCTHCPGSPDPALTRKGGLWTTQLTGMSLAYCSLTYNFPAFRSAVLCRSGHLCACPLDGGLEAKVGLRSLWPPCQ
ncbi:GDNF family receptor alpha-4 [Acomys russatus]|uniref:GDNF family receptor alpha-4 n=1 Tax=Acomys russatus TaxID=60746 RepID=UPI0021E29806|nr:GDNF family receptor alpha-4 [Acomys russatus]